jgi:hypothetical protein
MSLLTGIGLLGSVYVVCRSLGLIGGSFIASFASKAEPVIRNNIGFAILSQAGVAIGLSLLAAHKLEVLNSTNNSGIAELGPTIVTTIAATTVIFEIIGPIAARFAIFRAGEANV